MGRYDALLQIDKGSDDAARNQPKDRKQEPAYSSIAPEPLRSPAEIAQKAPAGMDNITRNITSNTTDNITRSITLLEMIDDADIDELREPATQVQSFRLTDKNKEWLQEITYRLNKEVKRGRITQADILRLAFKFFEKIHSTQ